MPGLAMTRSFGDLIASQVGVISYPGTFFCNSLEIRSMMLRQEDKIIVLASDGVWEYLSNRDVYLLINRQVIQ